jgi:hypothetical protein
MVDTPARDVDPVGNNLDSVTPQPPPIEAAPRFSDVMRAGLTPGVTASLVCWLLYGIATLFGTDFDVAAGSSSDLVHVAWYQVLIVPVLAALVFALAATALRKRRHCRRSTLLFGYGFGALSLLPVLLQPAEVTWPTRIWLIVFHLVTIALVVPQVARVVGDSDPYVTDGHRRVGLEAG